MTTSSAVAGAMTTPTEFIVISGHILGQCTGYLCEPEDPRYDGECDCADLLEDDPLWGRGDDSDDEC